MRIIPFLILLSCLGFSNAALANDLPNFETITRQTADDITLVADFFAYIRRKRRL